MLITFKSKAAADVLMYATHAQPILDLLGKAPERGVITAEESAGAIQQLEAEIARRKQADAAEEAAAAAQDDDESDTPHADHVSFATRAYPLLEMLRAAHRDGEFVMWGV